MVSDSIFAHHPLDPDLIVETFFKKKGAVEYEGADFEMVDLGTSAHVCWRFKKVSCRTCLLMYCFFLVTKKVLKALFTCIFIAALLNSFDSTSYSSEWRRRYNFVRRRCLPLMCLEVLEGRLSCFSGRDWKGL